MYRSFLKLGAPFSLPARGRGSGEEAGRVFRVSYQHCAREGALPSPNSQHPFPKVTPLLTLSFVMKWWNNVAGSPEKATEGNVGTAGSWNPHPTHRNAFQKQAVCTKVLCISQHLKLGLSSWSKEPEGCQFVPHPFHFTGWNSTMTGSELLSEQSFSSKHWDFAGSTYYHKFQIHFLWTVSSIYLNAALLAKPLSKFAAIFLEPGLRGTLNAAKQPKSKNEHSQKHSSISAVAWLPSALQREALGTQLSRSYRGQAKLSQLEEACVMIQHNPKHSS